MDHRSAGHNCGVVTSWPGMVGAGGAAGLGRHRMKISAAVLACSGVRGLHDLRTRHAGDRIFVEFHLEVDGHLTIDEGHSVGDAAEASVKRLFPSTVEVTAHLEPAGIEDERLDDRVAPDHNSF